MAVQTVALLHFAAGHVITSKLIGAKHWRRHGGYSEQSEACSVLVLIWSTPGTSRKEQVQPLSALCLLFMKLKDNPLPKSQLKLPSYFHSLASALLARNLGVWHREAAMPEAVDMGHDVVL
jgi:hypothetical protein